MLKVVLTDFVIIKKGEIYMRKSILCLLCLLLVFPVVAQEELTCRTAATAIEGDEGDVISVSCPADCGQDGGTIWGTDTYTDDSSICRAAVHAGALTEEGGVVDIVILGGAEEFPSSEQNSILSSSWGSWGRSFGFVSSASVIEFTCDADARSLEGAEVGDVYQIACPSDCEASSVWGTNLYTDDSTVCTAAAHAGATTLEEGGIVTLAFLPGLEEYAGSEQNGIETSNWGSWDISFAFSGELACGQRSIDGAEIGDSYLVTCPANCDAGSVWGTDTYTSDSDICTAAAHAGISTLETGGTFILEISEGLEDYPATEQNGIESSSWGSWSTSYSFYSIGVDDSVIECSTRANEFDAEFGSEIAVTCPAGCDAGSIWGTDTYTDDSSICTAAAHSGVISLEDGGSFTMTIVEGLDEHPSSEQNGITSSSWGSWSRSFTTSK